MELVEIRRWSGFSNGCNAHGRGFWRDGNFQFGWNWNLVWKSTCQGNTAIIDESNTDTRLHGMGTTIVAALIDGKQSLIANIGDSRGYVYSNGQFTQITEDHSYVNELVKHGDITPDQAKTNPYKILLPRAWGLIMIRQPTSSHILPSLAIKLCFARMV